MTATLRARLLARAEALVNDLATFAHDQPTADFATREAVLFQPGQPFLCELLGYLAEDAGARTPGPCPTCGVRSLHPVVRTRWRGILSRFGFCRLPQPLVTCRSCGHAWGPQDAVLNLGRHRYTRQVRLWLLELGSDLPFRAAAARFESLTQLAISPETIRIYVQRVGQRLEEGQQAAISETAATQEAAEPLAPAPGTLVVQTDGVLVRYRDTAWHAIKVGLVAGLVRGALQPVSYVAARETPDRFGPRLLTEAARRGALEVVRWTGRGRQEPVLRAAVVLADGAPWIWRLAAEHFGERTEILDFWHATQHLWAVAHALYGPDTPEARTWVEPLIHTLRHAGGAPVRQVLRALQPSAAGTQEVVVRRELGYFTSNQGRLAYPTYAAAGLPLGSGAVESSCRQVVQLRLKRPGVRWSEDGAHRTLQVRCWLLSGRSLRHVA